MPQNSGVLAPHYPMPGTRRVCMDLCPRFPALTAAAGSAPRFCRLRYTPAAPACSPHRSGPTARCAAGTPISFWSARQSPPSPRFCRTRQNAWTPLPRRYDHASEQPADPAVLVPIDPLRGRYFRQSRYGPSRDRSRGDSAFNPVGQAQPVQLKVLPPAKRLCAAAAAPALWAGAGPRRP